MCESMVSERRLLSLPARCSAHAACCSWTSFSEKDTLFRLRPALGGGEMSCGLPHAVGAAGGDSRLVSGTMAAAIRPREQEEGSTADRAA